MNVDLPRALALLTALSVLCYAFFLLLTFLGLRRVQRRARPARAATPAVSILKPCAGVDDALESCLESFCALDYPAFEILCGVHDLADPAVPLIERVRARHPAAALSVVVTAAGRSVNPKVAQLEVLARRARHELLWISDSNTRVAPSTLGSLVEDLAAPGTAMVVSPVVGAGESNGGAALENLHLAAFVAAASYAVYAATGRVAAPGKSALLRRASLEAIGGFEELGRYCAEDNVLVDRLRALGERVRLGRSVVVNVNVTTTLARFAGRQLRWTQLRWVMAPAAVLFEPLLAPVVPAALLLLAAPSPRSALVLLSALLAQGAADLALVARLRGAPLPARYAPLACLRPFVLLLAWARAAVARKVVWRGHVRWIGPGSLLLTEPPLRARLRATLDRAGARS